MNSNGGSNCIVTSDYNSEIINDSYINNYKKEEEEKKYCCWSGEEEQIFQNALAETDPNSPTFYEDLASRIPWKYIHEIKQHYRELIGETDSSGHDEENLPIIIQRIISPSPPEIIKNAVSNQYKSTKNVPWTEQEHQLFLMGLEIYGKGKWKFISKFFVQTRTPAQVASHAQKFFAHHRKLEPPGVNKFRRHSIFDNTDPYFLPNSQESYSNPPPPPLPPPLMVVQNHPKDHQNGFVNNNDDNIDQNTFPNYNNFFPQILESNFPGVGNFDYDEYGLSGTHQLTAADSFLPTENGIPSTGGGGAEEVFFAETDDDHQYYNLSSSSSAGSTNCNYNYLQEGLR